MLPLSLRELEYGQYSVNPQLCSFYITGHRIFLNPIPVISCVTDSGNVQHQKAEEKTSQIYNAVKQEFLTQART